MSAAASPVRLDVRAPPFDPGVLSAVADHLRTGGLVAYPTETVYGFGSLARPGPVERLLELKGRDPGRPLLLLISGHESVRELAWSEEARELAEVFWPGAVTLVLPDPDRHFPDGVRSPRGGVAVRRTPHPLARILVEAVDEPVTSTSANAPGGEPARTADRAEEVIRALGCEDEMWLLDGGELPPSEPSTIIDCTGAGIRILREGTVPASRVRCVRPELT